MSKSNLNILRVSNTVYPLEEGGLELHVDDLSEYQSKQGHNVELIVPVESENETINPESKSYDIRLFDVSTEVVSNKISLPMSKFIIRNVDNYDIVHAHSHLFFHSNIAALKSAFSDTPLVITNHGYYSQTAPKWLQRVFLPTVGRLSFELSDCIFCYTEEAKSILQDHGIKTSIKIVPNGIDCNQIKKLEYVDECDNELLFVGRFVKGKGVNILPDILAHVHKHHPETELHLVGDGPLLPNVRRRAKKLGLRDKIHVHGRVENKKIPKLYNRCTIVIHPSRTEAAAPRVAMEAWACETPVVMYDFDQLQQGLEDCTSIVKEYDAQSFANHVLTLLDDPTLRQTMGIAGRERVRDTYSWKSTAREVTQTYQKVIKNEDIK